MAKFGYNDNTIRIQRDIFFTSGNMKRKYSKWNSWIVVSDETVPKPKVKKSIKWFPKHSDNFLPFLISEQSGGNISKTLGKGWLTFQKNRGCGGGGASLKGRGSKQILEGVSFSHS